MESIDAGEGFQHLIELYASQSRWPEVRRYALEWLQTKPTDTVAHYWAAWAALQMGELSTAEQHIRILSHENPSSWVAPFLWTELFLARGEVQGALAAIQHALTLAPEEACCHHSLGRVHLRRGEHPEALRAIEVALQFEPDDAHYRMLHAVIDRIVAGSGTPESALDEIATLKQLLSLDPRNPWLLARIGRVYATEIFDYDRGVDFLRQALEIDVSNADVRRSLLQARELRDPVYRLLMSPVAQLDHFDTDCPHWQVPWFVLPIVFYAVLLLVAGAVFNLLWTWLPAQLYRNVVLADLQRSEAPFRWQRSIYQRIASMAQQLRRTLWLVTVAGYWVLQSALLLIYAPPVFAFLPLGCLSMAAAWRTRRDARRAIQARERASGL